MKVGRAPILNLLGGTEAETMFTYLLPSFSLKYAAWPPQSRHDSLNPSSPSRGIQHTPAPAMSPRQEEARACQKQPFQGMERQGSAGGD